MRVSIVIPFKDNEESLILTLKTVLKFARYHEVQVILVNDGSQKFQKYKYEINCILSKFERRKIINRTFNRGRAYSRNEGAKFACYPNLLFLDSDRLLSTTSFSDEDFDDSYVEESIRIGPIMDTFLRTDEIIVDDFLKNPSLIRKYGYYHIIESAISKDGLLKLNNPWIATFSGAMLISKKNFDKIGGFDESFTQWGMENIEFGYRMFKKNPLLYFIQNDFKTYHIAHSRETGFYDDGIQKSMKLFYEKHPDRKIKEYEKFLQGKISLGEFDESNNKKLTLYYYSRLRL